MSDSTSPYKGIRGGDPARRPPKFAVIYPCPNCSKPVEAITDFGRAGKHVCEECRDATYRGDKCESCGSRKGYVSELLDYYDLELREIEERRFYHKHCRDEITRDV